MRMTCFQEGAALAGTVLLMAAGSAAAEDNWQHTAVLYGVGASIDGNVAVGNVEADVDVSFSDVLDNLELGFMGAWRAEKGPLAVVLDVIYLREEQRNNAAGPFGQTRTTVDADQVIVELDVGHDLTERLSAYGGLRYWQLEVDILIIGGGPLGQDRAASGSEDWLDPVAGLRYVLPLGESWQLIAKGDIGGFGVGSDFSWQGMLTAAWSITEHASVLAGVRFIDVDFEDGTGTARRKWDVVEGGPLLGFAWRF